MTTRNLVLTGFMGTGKTSVGKLVAQQLGREFVDMDVVLAAREQMPVTELFAQRGEAHFRVCEGELCAELANRENLVIATGGGALLDPRSNDQFANALVICLDASAFEILERLNGTHDRPLLNSESEGRREWIEKLLAARREAYAQIACHVNTTGRTLDEVAHAVIDQFKVGEGLGFDGTEGQPQGSPLQVRTPEGSYPIHLGHGLLDHLSAFLPRAEFAARCAVVTNPTVGKIYAARVADALRAGGFDPTVVEMPDGEAYKTLDTLRDLYDQFIAARLERRSLVLALGGGVVGDVAGFAAATFLRGVPFVQIPTTLLAMVDASIGGKVAVDHPAGKNLIGAFKFPRAVIADADVLRTLPVEESRAGLAEVIKHGIIGNAQLFNELGKSESLNVDLIARAIRVKIDIVERDPFEENVRGHLNLGHTFGHALENLSGYRLRHGYAVATGTTIAARLAVRIGWCDAGTRDRIIELLEAKTLPTRVPRELTPEQIIGAMGADKKIREGKLHLILPRAIGQVDIADNVRRQDIIAALEESRA